MSEFLQSFDELACEPLRFEAFEVVAAEFVVRLAVLEDVVDDRQEGVPQRYQCTLPASPPRQAGIRVARYVLRVARGPGGLHQHVRSQRLLGGPAAPPLAALSLLPGHIPAQEARWSAVGNWPCPCRSRPHEALGRPLAHPGIVSSRSTASRRGQQGLDPGAEGAISASRASSLVQEHAQQETMMVGDAAAGPAATPGIFPQPPPGQIGQLLRVLWPAIMAWSMSRPETPRTSLATRPSLMLASSSTFWMRLATAAFSRINWLRCRVRSRSSRIGCGGTKLAPQQAVLQQLGDPLAVLDVGLAAGHLLDVLGVDQDAPRQWPSRRLKTGFQ